MVTAIAYLPKARALMPREVTLMIRLMPMMMTTSTAAVPMALSKALVSEASMYTCRAMVSPRARPRPRMIPATIPERAEGSSTYAMVCQCVLPRARAPLV